MKLWPKSMSSTLLLNLSRADVRLVITNKLMQINAKNEMKPKIFIPLNKNGVLWYFSSSFIYFLTVNLIEATIELATLPSYFWLFAYFTLALFLWRYFPLALSYVFVTNLLKSLILLSESDKLNVSNFV